MAGESRRSPVRIGVLSDDVSNGYSTPILSELCDAARECGATLFSFVEWLDPETIGLGQRRLTTDLAGPSSVDAILLLPIGYNMHADDLARYCERFRPLPLCAIPDITGENYSRVSVDNEPGMRQGVTHLVETHGYRRIGFVRGPERSAEADLRYRVYREVLEFHGITPDPRCEAPGNYVTHAGLDAVRLFFDERKLELDAIVCANDGMALGVLEGLKTRGMSVPGDVALIGFDDVDIARYADPPLTTVRQPLRELGRAAFDLLLRQLEPGSEPERVVLSSELVIRESCGCVSYRQGDSRGVFNSADSIGLEVLMRSAPEVTRRMYALGIPGAPEKSWAEAIFGSFVAEVAGEAGAFRNELRTVLNEIGRVRGDVGGFQKVLTMLWQHAREALAPGSPEWRRADVLLHIARATTSGTAERMQSSRQVRFEDFAYKLTHTGNALGMAVDQAAVGRALAEHLPQYGIPSCYVCLYDGDPDDAGSARLVAAFGEAGQVEVPDGGIPFPPERLVPDAALLDGHSQYVVGPLARKGHSPGYAVFARGPFEGFVYESLFAQIGGAMQRLDLVRRLLEEASLREATERQRLKEELELATRIQTGILPRSHAVGPLDISAVMLPATEVGGDYYDVIDTPSGCWLGIGDVAGHGLPTGLVMLMLQSAVSSLLKTLPEANPRDVLCAVNAVLYENIRERLRQDEHVTLTLLRFEHTGQLCYAGAHEDILIYRAAEGQVECLPTPGTWVGAAPDIAQGTTDSNVALLPGDVLLLYTDGVTEARDLAGEMFGPDRLAHCLLQKATEPVVVIRDFILKEVQAWMRRQDDDITLLVARRL
jgi:sigma-B regulation protein RsbU (phosphoserine phosphatase)